MDPRDADRFMNEMLRSRIGRRVLAEQHIALSHAYDANINYAGSHTNHAAGNNHNPHDESAWIGIVNTKCRAHDIIERCGELASQMFIDSFGKFSSTGFLAPPKVNLLLLQYKKF